MFGRDRQLMLSAEPLTGNYNRQKKCLGFIVNGGGENAPEIRCESKFVAEDDTMYARVCKVIAISLHCFFVTVS